MVLERLSAADWRAPLDAAWLRQRVDALPALPQAVRCAQQALQREDSDDAECAALLARDPAIAARVLRLANSPFYGRPGRIATLADAVTVLGRRTLDTLMTTAAVAAGFRPRDCPGFDFPAFWRHAFGTALVAQALAQARGADGAQAFSAGLLHDIGRLVLAVHAPQALAAAQALAGARALPPLQAERDALGLDHAAVGGLIAAHWQFPPAVVAAIVGHHGPTADEVDSPAGLVQAADAVVHALDLCAAADERVPATDPAIWQRLALSTDDWRRVFAQTEAGVAALAQALAL